MHGRFSSYHTWPILRSLSMRSQPASTQASAPSTSIFSASTARTSRDAKWSSSRTTSTSPRIPPVRAAKPPHPLSAPGTA